MLFYDFEVFKYDWLVVVIDMTEKKQHVIINNKEELDELYQAKKNDICLKKLLVLACTGQTPLQAVKHSF